MQFFTFMTYFCCLQGICFFNFGFNGMASIDDSLKAVSKCEYRNYDVSSVSNICRAANLFSTLVTTSLRISFSYCNVVQSYGLVLLFFFLLALKLNFMCAVTIRWSDAHLFGIGIIRDSSSYSKHIGFLYVLNTIYE